MKEWRALCFNLKHRLAPPALSEKNPGNIKQGVNPGNLVDFPTNQMNCMRVRIQGHADALRRKDILARRRTLTMGCEVVPATLIGPALIAIT
ncbi:MAG: hypothetical protein NTW21_33925 [Verrucomicrobia bacterium]|nr:hypothetical protein [Verrucomicrobiota bacterium]